MKIPNVYEKLRPFIDDMLASQTLSSAKVVVTCQVLSAEEAIGNPGRNDFPLQKGKERLMQAEIDGHKGQAFTDMPGNFTGSVEKALTLPAINNFNRAVIVATLNAACRKFKDTTFTIHCRDQGPHECGKNLNETILERFGNPRIAFIGLQPAMVEQLSESFEIRVFDLDPDNIGKVKYGVAIENGDCDLENVEDWCDLFLVTGSTVVNGTIDNFLNRKKPVLFYGTTVAGAAELLGLERFCPVSS